ncbi:hypothetical protein HYPSUDRAFT_61442 [Hypholoma sublateritium FD-334 SS-4]|uniref:Cobalamin-independent methionine synthase MetE C-terminal/archaeal domain-containing protein n=1 Tax=Hypholoma sublateritium (strain FD-334 SS-4) TaxID=945553 RepID=A0A0D2MZ46_HYPSF|nr:hypothetical protein HYPSUDRAFT_61442 [Hypholoma sublateritium FD-334 SS-4]
MSNSSAPKRPSRASHVGSLLRPRYLFDKRKALEAGECLPDDLKPFEDEAIKQVLKLQQDVGIKTVTDGEMRREFFFEGVFDKLEGMTYLPTRPIATFKQYIPHCNMMHAAGIEEAETIYCSGKIKRTRPFYLDEFLYLKSLVPPEDVKHIKLTICSPSWFHQRHGSDLTYDLSVYKNDDEYFDDLAKAYREELRELYDLGCRHIQIDDPTFCYFCNESMIVGMEKAGVDHEALLDTYIRAINVITEGRPDDLIMSLHMCRGNYKGGIHYSEGGYGRIAIKLFNTLDVDVFYLEYDTERAGDFTPLKQLPLGKVVVLGLVTTKNPKLESAQELKARVNEAVEALCQGNLKRSRDVALDQLAISTQCGFASVWEGNPLTEEDQRKKLSVLVETARQLWPDDSY